MTWTELLLRDSQILFVVLTLAVLVVMYQKKAFEEFPLLAALLGFLAVDAFISVTILFFRKDVGLDVHTAYAVLFYSHWIDFVCEAFLQLLVIYKVFMLAMAPLQGLQSIGRIVFRWVAAVSIMVSVAIAAGPHMGNGNFDAGNVFAGFANQILQGTGVLTICLLLFVCFSTKPLGLTYRSRTFGIVLGLGMASTTFLIESAWTAISPRTSLYSPIAVFGILGLLASVSVWGAYFVLPEAERKLILLPTTSPFFFWNRISEALGDSPGHVAIAGFRPDMLAAAELEMLTAPHIEQAEEAALTPMPAFSSPMLASANLR